MVKELPEEWEAGIGERNSDKQYTKFFYNPERELEIRVYTDPGEQHTVLLLDTSGEISETITSSKYNSEEKATEKAEEQMAKLVT